MSITNESGFDWRNLINLNKKYSVDDLYVTKFKIKSIVNKPPDNKLVFGEEFQDLDHAKNLEFDYLRKGVFRKSDDYFRPFKFGDWKSGEIWFDFSYIFDELREVSDKLGLNIGAEVYIKPLDKNSIIEEIQPLVIYNLYNEVFSKGFKCIATLCYRVNGNWYQATKLEVIKSTKKTSIIDEEIEDNFIEYIDNGQLSFSSKFFNIRDTSGYECRLNVSLRNPEVLDQISSRLLVLSKRLSIKNIEISIGSISLNEIIFTAIQK